jgi:putative transposase
VPYDPRVHHRRSIRLSAFDYRCAGAYFVTICTYGRECILGDIRDGVCSLTDTGQMVLDVWLGIPQYHQGVAIDASVVMPNHIHGIVWLSAPEGDGAHTGLPLSLPEVVQRFKSLTTARYRAATGMARLWQRNYYERVIRNERELDGIRQYIIMNPDRWAEDADNPHHAL